MAKGVSRDIRVETRSRTELRDITPELRSFLRSTGAESGVLTVFVPHTTAGLTINENADPDVARDMMGFFSKLVPEHAGFRHAEGNSDAHIKTSLFGPSLSVLVEGGDLRLGTWQSVYFAESDGPRSRKVWLKFQPD